MTEIYNTITDAENALRALHRIPVLTDISLTRSAHGYLLQAFRTNLAGCIVSCEGPTAEYVIAATALEYASRD